MKKNASPRIIALTFLVALACGCLLTACGCAREAEQPDLKPVIYLYPEQKEEDVSVELDYAGDLTCTYPEYNGKWNVTAQPDGTLTDADGQTYNYLYWEGENDTAAFLESALDQLGLTRKEANEFIVYWLPLMQDNPYNIISFQTDAYTQAAQLHIDPEPDTLLRVFMAWKPADAPVDIPAQGLTAPERVGFTVVEWGGCRVK